MRNFLQRRVDAVHYARENHPQRARLDMDHNHVDMFVRGLLCVRCNRAVRDWMTPEWALNLSRYLDRSE